MSLKIHVFIYAFLIFSNHLKMIKIDRNRPEIWQIVCEKYVCNISAFVGFIVW